MLLTTLAWPMYLMMMMAGNVLVSWFILYIVRFRYPPLVRQLRDLRWGIRIGLDPWRIPLQKLRPRGELLADVFHHAMYPVTGDSRYILGSHPYPIATISYSLLKKAYRSRPTCQELLVDLELDRLPPCSDNSPGIS